MGVVARGTNQPHHNYNIKIEMITQKEFVRQCYDRYYAQGLEPGNLSDGNWEKAHYPLPQPEGDRWVWLLKDDHLIQGVLQSEEFGRCCFFAGDVKAFLKIHWCDEWFEISDLYEKWHAIQASNSGKIGGRSSIENGVGWYGMSEEDKFEARSKGGKNGGNNNIENGVGWYGMSEEDKFEARSKGGKTGGKTGGKVTTSLTYISLETGFVSGPGPVSRHNKWLGYSKDAKARIPDEQAHLFVKLGGMSKMNPEQFKEAKIQNAINLEIYRNLPTTSTALHT